MLPVLVAVLAVVAGVANGNLDMDKIGMPHGKKMGEHKAPARKADIPLIKCQVCEMYVKQAIKATKELRAAVKPGQKFQEADIIDRLEKICDPDKDAGEWINMIDLQEDGDKLKVVDMGQVGACETECRTVARTCMDLSESLDLSDLSEMLYKDKKRATINNYVCYDESGFCSKKAPAMPKSRPFGEDFKPLTEEEQRHKKMMRSMKEAGLSGTMYDRESMMASMNKGEDDDDDDDAGMPTPSEL
uniref:Saposin B-type domain-containing protein n=1 Tax=Chlamydomonas leiostraca TaxID=1034604 RepID=A0A7S0RYT4_9CHLO|mmetsp:Transcript_34817/g.88227  ORF Transcript_34817/g.88227 Transcript_34817/m.88227 type:complete len:245 (+) Transcript_34817:104-838(+)|eukprot:CAMPEP_0202858294 /NCGR_PEP_ID=MMETSP1391-20130828/890_1 /ASSEMBLY_ACC=CAM_ASM_000867 /TAXON_ID=1034604 /ORGANISM="Chlamydomonas leiostraca, Strain SAG 11-49" /LENGTH=244 /DNA_ID=CAMNT_0049537197 /DNA_START=76 /DNA_END=810 /DNA_ORIENTATION=-